jgi:hypothetical protein
MTTALALLLIAYLLLVLFAVTRHTVTILRRIGRFEFNLYSITRVGGIGTGLFIGEYMTTLTLSLPFLVLNLSLER